MTIAYAAANKKFECTIFN